MRNDIGLRLLFCVIVTVLTAIMWYKTGDFMNGLLMTVCILLIGMILLGILVFLFGEFICVIGTILIGVVWLIFMSIFSFCKSLRKKGDKTNKKELPKP
jgi:CHASE2 domain-containing sensor protein